MKYLVVIDRHCRETPLCFKMFSCSRCRCLRFEFHVYCYLRYTPFVRCWLYHKSSSPTQFETLFFFFSFSPLCFVSSHRRDLALMFTTRARIFNKQLRIASKCEEQFIFLLREIVSFFVFMKEQRQRCSHSSVMDMQQQHGESKNWWEKKIQIFRETCQSVSKLKNSCSSTPSSPAETISFLKIKASIKIKSIGKISMGNRGRLLSIAFEEIYNRQ